MMPANGLPIIGQPDTKATRAGGIVECSAAIKAMASTMQKHGARGQLVFTFFDDNSYAVVSTGAVLPPDLATVIEQATRHLMAIMDQATQLLLQRVPAAMPARRSGDA